MAGNSKKADKLQEMILAGKRPSVIASTLDVTVSTVHNHKRRLKNQGVEVPSFENGRPKGTKKSGIPTESFKAVTGMSVDDNPINNDNVTANSDGIKEITLEIGGIPTKIKIIPGELIIEYGTKRCKIEF